jgi:hypothetical protein
MEHYGNLEFATKKELFKFLSENRDKLIAQKKAVKKEVDCSVIVKPILVIDEAKKKANKAGDMMIIDPVSLDSLKVVCVINTTNFLDSHQDVHIPGIWNKTLQENKMIMHLQEHDMEFDKIIADGDNLKAYTKRFKWSELGYPYQGETEALVFESEILRKRNEFMLNQYANGWVKNHSVGMYYVKTDFALNDEDYPNEYEAWKKYYPMIVNPEMADTRGYFWYVIEAKCVEGSAVPIGSNTATPTLDNGTKSKNTVVCEACKHEFDYLSVPEAGMGYVACPECQKPVTQKMIKTEPSEKDTQPEIEPEISPLKNQIDYEFLIKNLKN